VVLLRRNGDWHEPELARYADERKLQALVKTSPSLLPGVPALAMVEEFRIPGVGSADLVGIGAEGEVVIVECKLRANPQNRREVVGQVLAYAGGLWTMGYELFTTNFQTRSGQPPSEAIAKVTGAPVDADELRTALTATLGRGAFTLFVAVDSITPDLKGIIEYLNSQTIGATQIFAVELAYARDRDVELLVPTVYGSESANRPRPGSGLRRWTAAVFAERVEQLTDGPVRAFIDLLLEHGSSNGHHAYYGSGQTAGMSYYYALDGQPVSVWALYLQDTPQVAVQLGEIVKRSRERAIEFVNDLRADAPLESALSGIDTSGPLNKYPQMAIDPTFTDPATHATFFAAIDHLIKSQGRAD
jgi:hypothetical protein